MIKAPCKIDHGPDVSCRLAERHPGPCVLLRLPVQHVVWLQPAGRRSADQILLDARPAGRVEA